MNGYPKEELLDLLADLRRKARLAFSSDKLIAVLKMINNLEIEMLATVNPASIPTSSVVVENPNYDVLPKVIKRGGPYDSRYQPVESAKSDYRKEDERIPLPNPNYELGN